MEQPHPILRFIPEGLETGVLIVLAMLAVTAVIRLTARQRWAVSFACMLITMAFGGVICIPILALGSRLIGPAAILFCPPAIFVVALGALAGVIEPKDGTRYTTAAVAAVVLTAFGFVIVVLPAMRAAHHRVEVRDYRTCLSHLRELGVALRAYADDHWGNFPRVEEAQAALTSRPKGGRRRGPYLKDPAVIICPAMKRVRLARETSPLHKLGCYTYAQPAKKDPSYTYVARCRRHMQVRRFWTVQVGLYLRKDGKIDVIPLRRAKSETGRLSSVDGSGRLWGVACKGGAGVPGELLDAGDGLGVVRAHL